MTASGWDAPLHPTLPAAIAGILLLMFLLFLSALISGSEVAYFSLDPHDQQKKGNGKKPCPPSVLRNLEDPERLLATILVANNLVNIAIVVITVYAVSLFVRLSEAGAFGSLFSDHRHCLPPVVLRECAIARVRRERCHPGCPDHGCSPAGDDACI